MGAQRGSGESERTRTFTRTTGQAAVAIYLACLRGRRRRALHLCMVAVIALSALCQWSPGAVRLPDTARAAGGLAAPTGGHAGATSSQSATLLLHEPFVNNDAGWPTDEHRYFEEDGYHLIGEAREAVTAFPVQARTSVRAADVALEVQLRKVEGPDTRGYGIALRSTTAPRRAYRLFINTLGMYTVDMIVDGTTTRLISWRRAPSLVPGAATNTLRLVAQGNVLSVFLNGQQAGRLQNDIIPEAGAVQLIVENDLHIVARSLTASSPGEQDVAPFTASSVLFQDLFSDNREHWPAGDSRYLDESGYHVITEEAELPVIWSVQPRTALLMTDASVEAELRMVDGPEERGFGISLRSGSSPLRGYRLLINAEGSYSLYRRMDGDQKILIPWKRSGALQTGDASNAVRLVAHGKTLSVWLNGQHAGMVEDDEPLAAGTMQIVASSGLHVVARSLTVAEATAQDLVAAPEATAPPCLPQVERISFEPAAVKAGVRNPCGTAMVFSLSLLLLDEEGGQPVAATGTIRWDAPDGDERELSFLVDTRGARAALSTRGATPPGEEPTFICEAVGATPCLVADVWLRGAVDVLRSYERGQWLLKIASDRGIVIGRAPLALGQLGTYAPDLLAIVLDERLDAYSDWERAMVLAHELQHAADHASGLPLAPLDERIRREEDAFRRTAELWHLVWKAHLPEAQNTLQEQLNDITRTVTRDPLHFAEQLTERYRY